MKIISKITRCHGGSSAAEFAMVLPLLILFIFGLIDSGRFLWACNRAEKAAQMGARFAVVTDVVPSDLAGYKFASNGKVAGGDAIPTNLFGKATCTSSGCSCTGTVAATNCGFSSGAFNRIYDRLHAFLPELAVTNLQIEYENIGLGYAGDPVGLDIAPLVRITINNLAFRPMILFGGSITLPSSTTTLTLEDGVGSQSN
jgi:hypothetical protein